MTKHTHLTLTHFLLLICTLTLTACTQKQQAQERTITVNNTSILYEVSGTGKPIILLHGNGGSHHDLDTLHAQLQHAGYKVYALDSRGQGANPPLTEYHYKDMADDVYQFCQSLHINNPIIYGWSDGGIIALELEIMHPGTASQLIICGANLNPNGLKEDFHAHFIATADTTNPLTRMMLYEPNITIEQLSTIQCPVLVCAGEHDLISEAHTRLIAESIPKGELLIIPNEDHGSYIWHSPKIGNILLQHLQQHPTTKQSKTN